MLHCFLDKLSSLLLKIQVVECRTWANSEQDEVMFADRTTEAGNVETIIGRVTEINEDVGVINR